MTVTEQPTPRGGPSSAGLFEPLTAPQIAALAERASNRVCNPVESESLTMPALAGTPAEPRSGRRKSGAKRAVAVAVAVLLAIAGIAYLTLNESGAGTNLVDGPPLTTVAPERPTTSTTTPQAAPEPSTPATEPTLPLSPPAGAPPAVAPTVAQPAPTTTPVTQPASQTTITQAVPVAPPPTAGPSNDKEKDKDKGNGGGGKPDK